MKKITDGIFYAIKHFLSPGVCAVCQRGITPRYLVCRLCEGELEKHWIFPKKIGPSEGLPPFCLQDRNYFFDRRVSLYQAGPHWKSLLRAWKFRNERFLYKIFLIPLEKILPLLIECQIERIGIVASARAAGASRNYSPCLDLARELGRRLHLPVGVDLRKKKGALQSKRGYADRFWKMHNSLECSLPEPVSDYLLVEDIFTTGATANEAARMLKKAGVKRVTVLSMLLQPEHEII